jgi:hypothetical protein
MDTLAWAVSFNTTLSNLDDKSTVIVHSALVRNTESIDYFLL